MAERTGLWQLPRDPEKAVRHLAGKPVEQLLTGGLDTDDTGRIMVKAGEGITTNEDNELTLDALEIYLQRVAYGD